jgi:NADH-quinone oxidoreductase subunit J
MQNLDLVQWVAFIVLTVLTLGAGFMVAQDRNLFHGALWLLVCLFGVAGFFVMLAAPFLAAVQVLVYMGAIVILIIMAIMLTRRLMGERESVNDQWPIGLAMSAIAFLVIAFILALASNSSLLDRGIVAQVPTDTVVGLGKSLVDTNQYMLPFELASLLLTGAMIGAIVIARED